MQTQPKQTHSLNKTCNLSEHSSGQHVPWHTGNEFTTRNIFHEGCMSHLSTSYQKHIKMSSGNMNWGISLCENQVANGSS